MKCLVERYKMAVKKGGGKGGGEEKEKRTHKGRTENLIQCLVPFTIITVHLPLANNENKTKQEKGKHVLTQVTESSSPMSLAMTLPRPTAGAVHTPWVSHASVTQLSSPTRITSVKRDKQSACFLYKTINHICIKQ